jgi:RimJ/RimL family protein N-acetyltransferase/anti-anti-sigma regulatory factor
MTVSVFQHGGRGTHSPPRSVWLDELRLRRALTSHNAHAFCRDARDRFEAGARALTVRLDDVTHTDVVGLAALYQTADLAARFEASLTVVASREVERAVLEAGLGDALTLEPARYATADAPVDAPGAPGDVAAIVARTPELTLRQPSRHDVALFAEWAHEPILDHMLGSELLYRCRRLGAHEADFMALLRHDPTSLTLLVEPAAAAAPVGFVRLYGINLAQGFAFLETALTTRQAVRRGWGISASRLFVAYACDAFRLQRVEAKVFAYNVLSINALRRNGFHQEGVLRAAHVHDGRRWDILVYSMLAEEMREQRATERFPSMGLWD